MQVSMTGVRMGESFLQIGCSDRALLAGLAAKVGLSGTAAVAAFDQDQVKRVNAIAARVGALIEVASIADGEWPFEPSAFDMVVVDDTDDSFWGRATPADIAQKALSTLRPGGRIEVVTPVKSAHGELNYVKVLAEAGFKPVRILAERGRLRFVEGLRPQL